MSAMFSISPSLQEAAGVLLAEPVDVHRAHEVLDRLEDLARAAGAIGADRPDALLRLDRRGAAGRAASPAARAAGCGRFRRWALAVGETTCGITSPARITITSSPSRTSLRRRSSSLWSVASLTVTPDTCTGSSCAKGTMWPVRPTFQATRLQHRGGRGGRELPGDRAARLAAHHAELALQLEVVDLHHHAVDLEVEPVAPLLPGPAGGHHLVDGVVHLDVAVDAEAVRRAATRATRSGCRTRRPSSAPDPVAPHRERPRRGELGVELADRAGRGVARVGEGRLSGLGALLVQLGERGQRQVDLAAHLQQRRRVVDRAGGSRRSCAGSGSRPRPPRRCRAWRRAPAPRPRRRARSPGRRSWARSRRGRRPSRRPGAPR